MKKIKVLIIDDSALIRKILTEILLTCNDIEVVGTAQDPIIARTKIKELSPDVLTLDVEMPRMDGLTFLSNLMRLRPMPVVMISSLTEAGADITLQALELGAFDFIAKPKIDVSHTLDQYRDEIIEKIIGASGQKEIISRTQTNISSGSSKKLTADAVINKKPINLSFKTTEKIIAIGASTGGTEAIKEVLMRMPANSPGVVITQHIPEQFSLPFSKRMNLISKMTVCQAEDGQQILPGHAYIAPGDSHLLIKKDGARYICELSKGPAVNRHRPSVDVMFRSIAQNVGSNAIGVILTGMGADGAEGLMEMKENGAATLSQDEKTSVVWGMPGEAVKLGGVDKILPLQSIASALTTLSKH